MAEAWLNYIGGEMFEAESAGLEPGVLNPLVIEAMQEAGIDISKQKTRAVSDVLQTGKQFAYVITVCDETSAERCPIFPGVATRLHWSFPDPSTLPGDRSAKLAKIREIRDEIRRKVEEWCEEVRAKVKSQTDSD